jgi:dTDP-4-dehydrorhamnose reductase
MRVFVIGASGLIGSTLIHKLKKKKIKVIGTYSLRKIKGLIKYDLLKDKVKDIFPDLSSSDVIILLSAYSNPNWIYKNKSKAKKLNILSTKNLIKDLYKIGCKLYFMSSVEVFNGKNGNYYENSRPNPLNFYGKTKFFIEKYIKQKLKNYCIIRTGWVVGRENLNRCVISMTYKSLLKKDAKMAYDNIFSMTDIDDFCRSLVSLITIGKLQKIKIVHVCSPQKIVRSALADFIIKFSKKRSKMKYAHVKFNQIRYSEPRGKINNLLTLHKELKNRKYKNFKQIIRQKVAILDGSFK